MHIRDSLLPKGIEPFFLSLRDTFSLKFEHMNSDEVKPNDINIKASLEP